MAWGGAIGQGEKSEELAHRYEWIIPRPEQSKVPNMRMSCLSCKVIATVVGFGDCVDTIDGTIPYLCVCG
jgi:hypothetical protein